MSTKLKAGTATSGAVIDADTAGILEIQTGSTPTTAITVDASQNVGIGGTPVSYGAAYKVLTVNGSTTGVIDIQANGTTQLELSTFTNIASIAAPQASGVLAFSAGGNTERMRITSDGKVVVGATGSFAGSKLQAKGTGGVAAAAGLSPGNNGDGTLEWYNASSGYVGAVTVLASTVVYGGTSDYRLKEDIVPMTGAIAKVSALKPVTYKWKLDGEAGEGFIAHELQEVCPLAVIGEKDAVNADGSIKPQEIDPSKIVALLTAAIQEQQAMIEELKTKVATLEAKLNAK